MGMKSPNNQSNDINTGQEPTKSVFNANQFNFFISKNDDYQKRFTGKPYNIMLAPTKNYVYPNANEFELRALADFIYETIGEK